MIVKGKYTCGSDFSIGFGNEVDEITTFKTADVFILDGDTLDTLNAHRGAKAFDILDSMSISEILAYINKRISGDK